MRSRLRRPSKPHVTRMPLAERRPLRALTRALPGGRIVLVPSFTAGDRLDGFLMRHGGEADRSRSEWQRLIGEGAVLLNGRPSKPSQRVVDGESEQIAFVPRTTQLAPEPQVPFEVVF